ncbi:MAG: M20 family metallopeptidase [Acidobacteriales bacterium]|nr:M20 family metallopeptidase [Terriglobales bacterium]
MLGTLRELVEVESPSGNKAAVDQLGRHLKELFERAEAKVIVHRQAHYGDHLQIEFEGGDSAKPAMLLGHFDTVWDVGTLKKMPFRIEKGRAYGPGVYDMKAGLAMMLFGVVALREACKGELPRPITIWLVTDEEVGSESSRAITERLAKRSESVFVLEPSQGPTGALKTARKGVGDFSVQATGVASHAGVDFEKGHSAIIELSRQVLEIAKFTDLERGITVNPGVVRGGTRTNVVAAEASVDVDVRIARMKDAALLEKKFHQLKPFDKHCKLTVSGGVNRPPMERTPAIVQLFKQAQDIAQALGFAIEERSTGGGSDGNFTAALGIPTLDGLGAVGEGAHADNEYIVLSELPKRTALVAGLLAGR